MIAQTQNNGPGAGTPEPFATRPDLAQEDKFNANPTIPTPLRPDQRDHRYPPGNAPGNARDHAQGHGPARRTAPGGLTAHQSPCVLCVGKPDGCPRCKDNPGIDPDPAAPLLPLSQTPCPLEPGLPAGRDQNAVTPGPPARVAAGPSGARARKRSHPVAAAVLLTAPSLRRWV